MLGGTQHGPCQTNAMCNVRRVLACIHKEVSRAHGWLPNFSAELRGQRPANGLVSRPTFGALSWTRADRTLPNQASMLMLTWSSPAAQSWAKGGFRALFQHGSAGGHLSDSRCLFEGIREGEQAQLAVVRPQQFS
ncbi:MAG: hypothetical protein JWO88_3867, partial [Frankiales bacterium]|nr:hypothetical protein [Frankiales bacterium]